MLGNQQEAELLGPVVGVLVSGEVATFAAPPGQRLHDPVDDLADAGLALWAARAAAEVLLGDDVDGQLGPGAWNLYVFLLEDDLTLLAGDRRRPALPLDQVVRVAVRRREVALEPKPDLRLVSISVAAGPAGDVSYVFGHLLENASFNHPR